MKTIIVILLGVVVLLVLFLALAIKYIDLQAEELDKYRTKLSPVELVLGDPEVRYED